MHAHVITVYASVRAYLFSNKKKLTLSCAPRSQTFDELYHLVGAGSASCIHSPLWSTNLTVENHSCRWDNSLFRLGHGFNSYVTVITRWYLKSMPNNKTKSWCLPRGPRLLISNHSIMANMGVDHVWSPREDFRSLETGGYPPAN